MHGHDSAVIPAIGSDDVAGLARDHARVRRDVEEESAARDRVLASPQRQVRLLEFLLDPEWPLAHRAALGLRAPHEFYGAVLVGVGSQGLGCSDSRLRRRDLRCEAREGERGDAGEHGRGVLLGLYRLSNSRPFGRRRTSQTSTRCAGARSTLGSSAEHLLDDLVPRRLEVGCDFGEDTCQGADPERGMSWDRDVVLPAYLGRQAQVAARLACHFVAEGAQGSREVLAGQVPR